MRSGQRHDCPRVASRRMQRAPIIRHAPSRIPPAPDAARRGIPPAGTKAASPRPAEESCGRGTVHVPCPLVLACLLHSGPNGLLFRRPCRTADRSPHALSTWRSSPARLASRFTRHPRLSMPACKLTQLEPHGARVLTGAALKSRCSDIVVCADVGRFHQTKLDLPPSSLAQRCRSAQIVWLGALRDCCSRRSA